MKNIFFTIMLYAVPLSLSAQDNDPKATKILNELSAVNKTYASIIAEYLFTTVSKEGKEDKWNGKLTLKKGKYLLEIPGNIIYCDSKSIYTYNKDAIEVTIKNVNESNPDQISPNNIFTLYEKGYKYKLQKQEVIKGITYEIISLNPTIKPDKKKFHTINLYIDKVKKRIVKMVVIMRDNTKQVYDIKTFDTQTKVLDNVFTLDLSKFKPEQIIDERD